MATHEPEGGIVMQISRPTGREVLIDEADGERLAIRANTPLGCSRSEQIMRQKEGEASPKKIKMDQAESTKFENLRAYKYGGKAFEPVSERANDLHDNKLGRAIRARTRMGRSRVRERMESPRGAAVVRQGPRIQGDAKRFVSVGP